MGLDRTDIYVTCTGNVDITTPEQMRDMKGQAIACNIGISVMRVTPVCRIRIGVSPEPTSSRKDTYKVGVYSFPKRWMKEVAHLQLEEINVKLH